MGRRSRYFNPRSPDGERPLVAHALLERQRISIHAPRMGSDRLAQIRAGAPVGISIHAPRMGSDGPLTDTYSGVSSFQSTLPGWGATRYEDIMTVSGFNFNPRSPDGERLVDCSLPPRNSTISIHAPRMGSDASNSPCWFRCQEFQSTLPGWGATSASSRACPSVILFQSTLPGWGATDSHTVTASGSIFQSTLPGWGATEPRHNGLHGSAISIHAPRMGSDYSSVPAVSGTVFQSTLPGWGATLHQRAQGDKMKISIHAPRMGSDPPLGAAANVRLKISIHAPRMGSDDNRGRYAGGSMQFQSTLPGWGATDGADIYQVVNSFQSTLPGWGATINAWNKAQATPKFQSTLPGWGATSRKWTSSPTIWAKSSIFNTDCIADRR